MRILFSLFLATVFAAGMSADNYFDDKKHSKPIAHMSNYSNDMYSLKSVSRDYYGTVVVINYHTPYRNSGGWMNVEIDDRLVDAATGEEYPLLFSDGIPKAPARYNFTKEGEVNMDIALIFPPIPESVKKVNTAWGLYDLDLGSVPVKANEGTNFWFLKNSKSKSGQLKAYSVNDDGESTQIIFFYTPSGYNDNSVSVRNLWSLRDPATGKSYKLKHVIGIPVKPKSVTIPFNSYIDDNHSMGFVGIFESVVKDGVKTFDFEASPNSSWNIQGITLE